MTRIVGIVGNEAAKFTDLGERRAREIIRQILTPTDVLLSSGHCHLGGIDIWAEEEAQDMGRYDPAYIFPPKSLQWAPHGYQERNLKIAHSSDIVHCITVDRLPKDYKGMTFPVCYHCARRHENSVPHVKSGGCWTMLRCKSWQLHVVQNFGVEFD